MMRGTLSGASALGGSISASGGLGGALSADNGRRSVQAFDTVADMQAAANLFAGMVAHTNGFHTSGDGGAAYYTISASGTANGMDVLALQNSLYATLMVTEPYVMPEQFGAKGDGTTDDSAAIQQAIDSTEDRGASVLFSRKTYAMASAIAISTPIFLDLNGATLKYTGANTTTFIGYHFDSDGMSGSEYGIVNGTLDGNSKCDVVLHVSGGKRIQLGNVRVVAPLVVGIKIDNANDAVWEMNAHDLAVNGVNSGGIATYCIQISAGVTDSFFERVVVSNASNAWLFTNAASNHFSNVHGYAYPTSNHPTNGMVLGGNNNIFENIVIDSAYQLGIRSNGTSNVFRNIELLNFVAESDRIGISDYEYNTYDTIIANADCDTVIQSAAQNFISVRNFINYGRPARDLVFTQNKLPWTFDIDLQSSRATTKFMANFEHRNKYAATNVETVISLPIPVRDILSYEVYVVQKTVSGRGGHPYTLNNGTDSIGITFYGDTDETVGFDLFVKPHRW